MGRASARVGWARGREGVPADAVQKVQRVLSAAVRGGGGGAASVDRLGRHGCCRCLSRKRGHPSALAQFRNQRPRRMTAATGKRCNDYTRSPPSSQPRPFHAPPPFLSLSSSLPTSPFLSRSPLSSALSAIHPARCLSFSSTWINTCFYHPSLSHVRVLSLRLVANTRLTDARAPLSPNPGGFPAHVRPRSAHARAFARRATLQASNGAIRDENIPIERADDGGANGGVKREAFVRWEATKRRAKRAGLWDVLSW